MHKDIDDIMVAGLKANRRSAQSDCYQMFAPTIFTSIMSICRRRDVAEDVLHDTFMTIFQNINQYRTEISFRAWCKKIAFNKTLNWVKKQKREDASSLENIEEMIGVDHIEGPFEDRALLTQLLSQLKPRARLIIWLFLVEGYRHDEIATMFQRSSSYSKSVVSRSLEKLRIEYFSKLEVKKYAPNL